MFKRFHCVRQMDGSDCGAAALATIARHHGLEFGLQTMRELAGTDRVGTNLLGLGAGRRADRLLRPRRSKAPTRRWPRPRCRPSPMSRRRKVSGTSSCCYRAGHKSVVIADPARGVQTAVARGVPQPVDRLPAADDARRNAASQRRPQRLDQSPTRPVSGPAATASRRAARSDRLRRADDAAGHLDVVLRAAPGRFGAGARRNAAAQRAGRRHGRRSCSSARCSACCGSTCWPTSAARSTCR